MKRIYYALVIFMAIACCSFITGRTKTIKLHMGSVAGHRLTLPADTPNMLPRTYRQRKFLNDISSISTDILAMPGNLVSYRAADTSYEFRTLHAIIKDDKKPVSSVIGDGTLYTGIVTPQTSLNGSYLIGGVAAKQGEVLDIEIRDVAIATVPDSLVDIDKIKAAVSGVSDADKKNLFYVKSVTLTNIRSKRYTQSKFEATKDGFYLVVNGKTYTSKEHGLTDQVVSMFLVPMANLSR